MEKTYIEIEPYTIDEMENLIFDFCDSITNKNPPSSEPKAIISQEIERAIRNMIDLRKVTQSIIDGDKTRNN